MLPAHPALANPEYYVPGLPADFVADRYGIAPADIAKLGSAENPYGASPKAAAAVAESLDRMHLYPSWTAEPLRIRIAEAYGYAPEQVICGAGETELISLVIRSFCEPGGRIQMPGPCFPIYHLFAEAEGRRPVLVHEATEPLGPVAGDHVHSYFAFRGGAIGVFDSRRDSVGVNERYGMEIVGSEGIVSLRGGSVTEGLMIYPHPLWAPARREQRWQPLELEGVAPHDGHYLAVTDLVAAIEEGREPICSGRDGVRALEMVLGAYRSQIAGARMALPLAERRHPLEVWR